MSNPLNKTMPEAALMKAIEDAADRLGYLCWHDNYSRRNKPGFLDLHICGHGRHWVLETKTAKGRTRPEQEDWIREYRKAGVDARIVRPDDLDDMLEELREQAA